jgi:hypothetical protein
VNIDRLKKIVERTISLSLLVKTQVMEDEAARSTIYFFLLTNQEFRFKIWLQLIMIIIMKIIFINIGEQNAGLA